MDYIHVPLDIKIPSMATGPGYAIAAVHRITGQRLLIKVSDLATREQLQMEIKRMNSISLTGPFGKKSNFIYSLTNEGAMV